MDSKTFLRVFAFTPSRPGLIDSVLRDEVLPELASHGDVLDVYAARHGADDAGERIVVSVWNSPEAVAGIPSEASLLAAHPELADVNDTTGLIVEPVTLALSFDRTEDARILRVFEGEVREGALADYVEDVRRGALADASDSGGLLALYLAARSDARFVTVSAWTCWEAVAAATGGDVAQPIRTRYPDRVTILNVRHYEVLPGTARPAPSGTLAEAALV